MLEPFGLDEVEKLLPIVDAAFGVDVPNVGFGRALGYAELLGDERRAAAHPEKFHDLSLTGGEAVAGGHFREDEGLCGGPLVIGRHTAGIRRRLGNVQSLAHFDSSIA